MPAGVIVRRIGESVEIRYRDVALFSTPRAREVMLRLGRLYFELALHEIAGHISDAAPVGVSGNLAQSWTGHGEHGGLEVLGVSIEQLRGRVFSDLPYAVVIDQGRQPGARMPPIDALMLWVQRVFGIPTGFDDDELERTAWAVARSIQRKGIEPRHYVDRGVNNALPRVEAIFEALGKAIAAGLVDADDGGSSGGGYGGGGLL